MSGITARQSLRTSPLMSVAVHCLVVPLPCATGDDRKPVWLLPRRRFAPTILPFVSGGTWTTKRGDNLGGGVVSKVGVEAHGEILHRKNNSAMRKIVLATVRNADILCACPTPNNSPAVHSTKPTSPEIASSKNRIQMAALLKKLLRSLRPFPPKKSPSAKSSDEFRCGSHHLCYCGQWHRNGQMCNRCPDCNGFGEYEVSCANGEWSECPTCEGTGERIIRHNADGLGRRTLDADSK